MVPDIIPMTLPTLQPLSRRSSQPSLGFEIDRDKLSDRPGAKIDRPDNLISQFPDKNIFRSPDKAGHQGGFVVLAGLSIIKYSGFSLIHALAACRN